MRFLGDFTEPGVGMAPLAGNTICRMEDSKGTLRSVLIVHMVMNSMLSYHCTFKSPAYSFTPLGKHFHPIYSVPFITGT